MALALVSQVDLYYLLVQLIQVLIHFSHMEEEMRHIAEEVLVDLGL